MLSSPPRVCMISCGKVWFTVTALKEAAVRAHSLSVTGNSGMSPSHQASNGPGECVTHGLFFPDLHLSWWWTVVAQLAANCWVLCPGAPCVLHKTTDARYKRITKLFSVSMQEKQITIDPFFLSCLPLGHFGYCHTFIVCVSAHCVGQTDKYWSLWELRIRNRINE